MNTFNRVVVTGMGLITPIGFEVNGFFSSLINGKHCIDKITAFDVSDYKSKLAAEVKGFEPENYMEKKEARRMDRFCQFAVAAAKNAMEDSGLKKEELDDAYRAGVIVGSGIGGILTIEAEHLKLIEKGAGRISPLFIPMLISNMAPGMIAITYGFKGLNYCPVSACATSANAIGEAFRNIKHGYLDVAIAGGSEASITPLSVAGFMNMTALSQSQNPNEASLPFDLRRSGFVIGEGAGMLVLESYAHAVKRGAKIYAEIAGYGATDDAYHITGPDPDGKSAAKAMEFAISEGNLMPDNIDYINPHGTGTPQNDRCETLAIKLAFGAHSKKLMVSSTKSMTGHLLGAAGAIEAIATIKTICEGIVPPTINLLSPDPECDLDYVPNEARKANIRAALSNSFGFGGHNASILILASPEV